MTLLNDDTQPALVIHSGRTKIRRLFLFLLLAISIVGSIAFGFALGIGAGILAPGRAVILTAIASLPASMNLALSPQAIVVESQGGGGVEVSARPRSTLINPTVIPSPETTAIPPTQTAVPTNTPIPPMLTLVPTVTPIPPTLTLVPPDTPIPPTLTSVPTDTPIPPTQTPLPTATDVPPTSTTVPTVAARPCYGEKQAWVTGEMNVRERPTVSSNKAGTAQAGESFEVLESRQGETYCWLKISRGWMAKTELVSRTKPEQRIPSSAGNDVRQALLNLTTLVVAPENRCSPYDSDSYPYSQSVEAQIVARMGGRIYGPYTGTTFSSTSETDIEHMVAKSEAHDSGLCSVGAAARRAFSNDLLNLTLASPSVNRHQKSGKDFAEWTPALNKCWFADTVIKVKFKYRLTVDSREKAALERTLLGCNSVAMIFSSAVRQQAQPARQQAQPAQPAQQQAQPAQQQAQPAQQQAQPANNNWQQWDTNGNGRITCKEARAAGIAPVHRGHPAYPRMDDRDNDGVVCE